MKFVVSVLLSVLVLFAHEQARSQVPHILGTWELNYEKSDIPGTPSRYEVRQYYLRDDGFLVGVATIIDADGNPNLLQFTTKTDGRDSPLYDVPTLAEFQATGRTSPIVYAESPVDEYTISFIDTYDGNPRVSGTREVSRDGQTMTVRVVPAGQSEDNAIVFVYDRL